MIALLLVLLLIPAPLWAAIDCNDMNAVRLFDATPLDPETIAYTMPAGTNQVVFVGVGQRTGATPRTFTVTFGGQAMIAATTSQYTDPIGGQLFYLVNPPSGVSNVVVDWSAAPLADGIVVFACNGVDTVSPIRSTNQATGASTTPSVTVPTVNAGDVVVDYVVSEDPANPVEGANQTVIIVGNGVTEIGGGASWQAGSDGGVMSWTIANQQWSAHAAALKPAAVPISRHAAPMVFP